MSEPAYVSPPLDPNAGGEVDQQLDAVPELAIPSAPVEPGEATGTADDFAPDGDEPAPEPAPAAPPASEFAGAALSTGALAGSAPAAVQPADPAAAAQALARPLPRINVQAFCEDQRTAEVLQAASQDRRLAKAHVSIQMGGLEAAAAYYREAPTPNLIILESLHQRDQMLADLGRLAQVCDSGTKVVVVGHVNDVLLYRELIRSGVSEYLVMPVGVAEVMACLSGLYTDPKSEPLGHVIAFLGAKGGVGSSTVCHNVAWAISEAAASDVIIADFDLPFGTAGLDFNQDPVQGIADALMAPERIDEVLLDRLLSRCSDHLSLFAAPGTLEQTYDIETGACDAVVDVLRKNVPYITADLPHLWTGWARQVATQADSVVLTAAPDLANLRNAKNLMDKLVAARPNDAPPVVILNQVGLAKRPEISAKDFGKALEVDIRFVIEFDAPLFGTATNNGQMIEEVSAKAKAAEQFRELAMLLTDRSEEKTERSSLLAPILSRLNLKRAGK